MTTTLPEWPTEFEIWPVSHDKENGLMAYAVIRPRNVITKTDEVKCVQCGHLFANHVYLASVFIGTKKQKPVGGHAWCPCKGCPCHRSWAVKQDVGFDVRSYISDMTREQAIKLGVQLR